MKEMRVTSPIRSEPVALFIDGENLSHAHAAAIIEVAEAHGPRGLRRVYGHAGQMSGWREQGTLRVIDTCQGKNVADILLSLEALELALVRGARLIAIASSDRDFTPLALKLAEHGVRVIGIGEDKGNTCFRNACDVFEVLPSIQQTDKRQASCTGSPGIEARIHAILSADDRENGCRIADLNALVRRDHDFRITTMSDPAHRTWRGYLAARPETYVLDPKGPEARVRLLHCA